MSRNLVRLGLLAMLCAVLMGGFAKDASAQVCADGIVANGGIGDFVWFDQNQNGVRDPAEASLGINGVVVELRNSSGVLVGSRTTGAAVGSIPGSYGFGPLCPGTYTVRIVSGVPAGYVPTVSSAGSDPTIDSSTSPVAVTIVRSPNPLIAKDSTVDFGFIAGCNGSIGDRVWNDTNFNGIQEAGEPGMPGVAVRLLADGAQVATATTDANGNYSFPGLCPDDYAVVVDSPIGFASSPVGNGDPTLDSNANGAVIALGLNESNPTIDFGFYAPCAGQVGDRVWFDANRNGIQDSGELGIGGVTLELLNGGGSVIATAISGANGSYVFTGLCAGIYSVRVVPATLPGGVVPTLLSPPGSGNSENDSDGSPASVALATLNSVDLSIDFGYQAPCTGTVGDIVWNDLNVNGIQDAGEAGIANVRVTLRNRVTGTLLAVDTTDAAGAYLFEGLCLGDYIVEVDPTTLPGGMVPSPNDQGHDDAIDSDGVGHVAPVSLLTDSTTDLTIDFGYFRKTLIQIVKLTNGTDNNTPTGPTLEVGSAVTWTYRVTSTGSTEPLRSVVVVDDNGTPANTADDFQPIFSGGDANGNGLLDVGETWTFVANGAAAAGQYVNWATATGTGNLSGAPAPPSRALDHYFGGVPPPPPGVGRFTGGGFVVSTGRTRISFGLTIHCDLLLSNNLEVNWDKNRFHMTDHSTTVACTDDPAIVQRPPVAPLDTLIGIGTGRYNNVNGFTIEFTLVDDGEPGRADRVALRIFETANPANVVLSVPLQSLVGGNLQAHYDQPHK